MKLSTLRSNYRSASKICKSKKDLLKYLFLIYGTNRTINKITKDKSYTIDFSFSDLEDFSLKLRNNGGCDSYIFSEVFLHRYYHLTLSNRPKYILDLGANIGLATIYFSWLYPESHIASVEPMPNNLELLEWNLAANQICSTVIRGAVAVEDGDVLMEISAKDYGHSIASTNSEKTLKVKAYSIESLIKMLSWPYIDLLKIDIEGYETELLNKNTDWLNKVNNILIEVHDDNTTNELHKVAETFGFETPKNFHGLWLLRRSV